MRKTIFKITITFILLSSCNNEEAVTTDNQTPIVRSESSYSVLIDENVVYSEGLGHSRTSTTPSAVPLLLDIY